MADAPDCIVCGAKAVRWCDEWLGCENGGERVLRPIAELDETNSFACDAGLCLEHTTQIGHICGQHSDSIDRCPFHAENPLRGPDWARTKSEALRMRNEAWVKMRTHGLRERTERLEASCDCTTFETATGGMVTVTCAHHRTPTP